MANIFNSGLVLNALTLDKLNVCSVSLLGIASQCINFKISIIKDANNNNIFSYFLMDENGF